RVDVDAVIVETPVPKRKVLVRRMRQLGWLHVLGQCLFQAGIVPFLRRAASARIQPIIASCGYPLREFNGAGVRRVNSVNDSTTVSLIREFQPAVVVINGTRIISSRVL